MNARTAITTLLILTGSAPALAQQADKPLLSGPKVQEKVVPVAQETFGEGMMAKRTVQVPPALFLRALAALDHPETPEPLRLTPDQRRQLRVIENDRRAQLREYYRPYQKEMGRLRVLADEIRPSSANKQSGRVESAPAQDEKDAQTVRRLDRPVGIARPGQPRDADRGGAAITSRAQARERLEQIRAGAPSPDAWQIKAMDLLTDPQRDLVAQRIAALIDELAQERIEQREQQRANDRKRTGDDKVQAPDRLPTEIQRRLEQLTPEQRERLRQLTPEQREALIQRLRQRDRGKDGKN